MEIYRRLGVREVWFWHNQQLSVYCLNREGHQKRSQSNLLSDLNLALLTQYVSIRDPLEAITEWREQVRVDQLLGDRI